MKTITSVVPATMAFATQLFTRGTDAFGADQITKALGFDPRALGQLPPIPFSEAQLTRARELGQYLIFQVTAAKDGRLLTMKNLHGQFGNALGGGKLLYDTDWYKDEPFYTKDAPRFGWALVSREVIPGSVNEDYLGQTQAIADYLVTEVFKEEDLPELYQTALVEFGECKEELEGLRSSGWKKCAEKCAGLKLNQLFREKPVEVLYGLVVQHDVNGERLLEEMYTWTNLRSSRGALVLVGHCDSDGVRVADRSGPDYSNSILGVRFFRSGSANLES